MVDWWAVHLGQWRVVQWEVQMASLLVLLTAALMVASMVQLSAPCSVPMKVDTTASLMGL